MEIIILSLLGLLISGMFLKNAPMQDILTALEYEQMRNKDGRN